MLNGLSLRRDSNLGGEWLRVIRWRFFAQRYAAAVSSAGLVPALILVSAED